MTAAVVQRHPLDVLHTPAPSTSKFFAALDDADEAIARTEHLDWLASFAPAPKMNSFCPCGSEFEVRREPITLTDDERAAVADALGGLDVGDIVAGAINACRDREDHDAFAEWYEIHVDCEDRA